MGKDEGAKRSGDAVTRGQHPAVGAPLRRKLPAVPASVPVLRAAVADFVVAAGVQSPRVDAVKLAVSEAVTNAVMHAYVDDDEPGEVRVATCLREGEIRVVVSDDGHGMMPRLDSPGLGVGLAFIADTADSLDIASGEGGGTVLRMSFKLAPV
jgi:serine/threonine-protein kinase RsbW/stage II sporulation protein AB (anti-sigma F factor)